MVTVATWNVNSIKARLPHLLDWLKADKPDIVLLQETKCVNEAFPAMELEEMGYNLALHGEKTYNGVAILSKFPLDDVTRGLPGNTDDLQSRYVEAVVCVNPLPPGEGAKRSEAGEGFFQQCPHPGLRRPSPCGRGRSTVMRVASVYVPNGQTPDSDKFQHKLRFLDRLRAHVKTLLSYEEMLVVGGDYNIAPADLDVHNPVQWHGSVLTHEEARLRLRKIFHLGMYDAHRLLFPSPLGGGLGRGHLSEDVPHDAPLLASPLRGEEQGFTWWDYRAGAFAQDDGLRIDHLLLSPQAADRLESCEVKKGLRALEKASDHAPVVGTLAT